MVKEEERIISKQINLEMDEESESETDEENESEKEGDSQTEIEKYIDSERRQTKLLIPKKWRKKTVRTSYTYSGERQ